MSQCVPSWDLDDHPPPVTARPSLRSHSNSTAPADVPMSDYEVAELTWENGQLAMHGLGPPRSSLKPLPSSASPTSNKYNNTRASGTLESIVNQATRVVPYRKLPFDASNNEVNLVPWFYHHRTVAAAAAATGCASATMTMDALVPCSNRSTDHQDPTTGVMDHSMHPAPELGTKCVIGCSTRVSSCSGVANQQEENGGIPRKHARTARVTSVPECCGREQSFSGSATFGRDRERTQYVTMDTCERDLGVGFTSTSQGSLENTSSGKPCAKATTTADDHDSVCHSRPQRKAGDGDEKKKGKSSVSNKRSRAAASHNQSERKRRDKINQRMKTLQKLVPNSSKTDKASMLDEVIEYLKQLQAQVQMMSRMNMPAAMMLPMTMQQQLQMSMMAAPMGLAGMGMGLGMGMGMAGMGMGMGMDMNSMTRPNIPGISPILHPSAFMPAMPSWDGISGDRLQATTSAAVMTDPLSTFLACQSQPMTMDAYSRLAAMYQQLHQPPASSSKN